MTSHFNAFFRIYDPPQSNLKPGFKLHRQVGGHVANMPAPQPPCTQAMCAPFLVSSRWWHSWPSLPASAGEDAAPASSLHSDKGLNSSGSQDPRSPWKQPDQRPMGDRPRPPSVPSGQWNSELCPLPDSRGPHCSV